jgi:hypothetical protein
MATILGRGQGGRPGRRRDPGERRGAGPGRCTLCLLPDRVNPAGDVTSRSIRPGIYGERGTGVAGPLGEPADGDFTTSGACLKRRAEPPKFSGRASWVSHRGGQGTMAASGVAPAGGVPNPLPHPWGRSDHTTGQAPWSQERKCTWGPSGASVLRLKFAVDIGRRPRNEILPASPRWRLTWGGVRPRWAMPCARLIIGASAPPSRGSDASHLPRSVVRGRAGAGHCLGRERRRSATARIG